MAGIGVNLRVTGHCNQGGRRYMEDKISVAYQQTDDLKDLEYAYIGIFDGHGGPEAASYVKDNLLDSITSHKGFWSEDDDEILQAIRNGYLATHYNMWKLVESWPKTSTGLPSTSGTTATIAFIMRGKIYVGHVGDSCIVLGSHEGDKHWHALPLTRDHKPENDDEMKRISSCGGKVITKSGVPRVVWNRPQLGHQGPVRRSTTIDEIPFLAVARSLGDFWSFNSKVNKFVVSPEPDVGVFPVDVTKHRCLVFGTDGLWNMLSPAAAIEAVQQTESNNESQLVKSDRSTSDYSKQKIWLNPSKCLVDKALEKWSTTKLRADNTSVVTLMLDPPGPPRSQVLLSKNNSIYSDSRKHIMDRNLDELEQIPRSGGLAIYTQYPPMNMVKNVEDNATSGMEHRRSTSGLPSPSSTCRTSMKPEEGRSPGPKKEVEASHLSTAQYSLHSSLDTNSKRRKRSEDALIRDENISDVENETSPEWGGEPKKRRLSIDKNKCDKPTWQQTLKSQGDSGSLMKKIKRTLRSNSAPADSTETRVKTLRSRNVDLRTAIAKRDSV